MTLEIFPRYGRKTRNGYLLPDDYYERMDAFLETPNATLIEYDASPNIEVPLEHIVGKLNKTWCANGCYFGDFEVLVSTLLQPGDIELTDDEFTDKYVLCWKIVGDIRDNKVYLSQIIGLSLMIRQDSVHPMDLRENKIKQLLRA